MKFGKRNIVIEKIWKKVMKKKKKLKKWKNLKIYIFYFRSVNYNKTAKYAISKIYYRI